MILIFAHIVQDTRVPHDAGAMLWHDGVRPFDAGG